MEQGTQEWHLARAGKITASRFSDAISFKYTGKGDEKRLVPTDTRRSYMLDLISEILSGEPRQSVSSASLQWGTDVEPFARQAYEFKSGDIIEETGFLLHDKYDFIGGSPDGLVGKDGIIEIKCPKNPSIHLETIISGMPKEHSGQVQGNLFVTGRKWCDFISFDPRTKEKCRLYIQRIYRDDEYIADLEAGLVKFWGDLQKELQLIESLTDRK